MGRRVAVGNIRQLLFDPPESEEFQGACPEAHKRNLRLVDVEVFNHKGKLRWVGL